MLSFTIWGSSAACSVVNPANNNSVPHLQLVQGLRTASYIARRNFSEWFPRKCVEILHFSLNLFSNGGRFSWDGIRSHNKPCTPSTSDSFFWMCEEELKLEPYYPPMRMTGNVDLHSLSTFFHTYCKMWICWKGFIYSFLYDAPYHFLLAVCPFLKSVFQNKG